MSLADLTDLTKVFVDPNASADEERFHAACRVLRREHPVIRVESELYRPFWAVTRHAGVLEIERDHQHFRNAPRPLLALAAVEALAEANSDQALRTLIHMDDPDHEAFQRHHVQLIPSGTDSRARGPDPRARRPLQRPHGRTRRSDLLFEELLSRVDELEPAGVPERSATVFVGGLKHLPVSCRVS